MKILTLACASLAALALSACASLPGASNSDVTAALKEIATDPNCGHTDRVSGNLGGLSGNNLNVFLERSCPPKTAPAPDLQALVDAAVQKALDAYTAPAK